MQLSKPIIAPSLGIQLPRLEFCTRERAFITGCQNSLPTNFKRHVEPDCQAAAFGDKSAIPLYGPGAAAEGNDTGGSAFEHLPQNSSFNFSKRRFSILFDDLPWTGTFSCCDDLIKIKDRALQGLGQRPRHRSLARAHETGDDDRLLTAHIC